MTRLAVVRAYARAKSTPPRSRSALLRWQDTQVRRAMAELLPRSPFYRAHYEGHDVEEWRTLPTIDKSIMMANFDGLNTVGVTLDEAMSIAMKAETTRDFSPNITGSNNVDVTVGLSSGTSGNRSLFLASAEDRATWAGTILSKLLPGGLLSTRRDRVAFFLRANSNLYEAVQSRRLSFQFFDLFDELAEHIYRLNAVQPTVLIAPPSMLRLLAKALRDGRLRIQPERVIAVAEVLEPIDERFIRRHFRQTVHQVYQATEGFLGNSCVYGTVHLAEDAVVIQREPVGDDPRRFTPIITDFRRRTQPIFRYRLNDILVERAVPCRCGSPFIGLQSIEGRADDVFYLARLARTGGGGFRPVFPDFVRRALLYASPDIEEYGVRQTQLDEFEIFASSATSSTSDSLQSAITEQFRALAQKLDCELPSLRFVDEWTQPRGAKLKRIERTCAAPDAS
ncbi:MAG: putative adenylate-forming enzyme [Polyangiales bacterium]|jgi:putative adenylate-forming enzyme